MRRRKNEGKEERKDPIEDLKRTKNFKAENNKEEMRERSDTNKDF
jgi:hypothetical protein